MENVPYTIRRATEDDFSVIQQFNQELFFSEHEQKHDDILILNWPHTERGREYFQKALTNAEKLVLVAESDNKPVGYLIASAFDRFDYRTMVTGELENMFVAKDARRSGVGKALVTHMKTWFQTKGIHRIYVSAYAKNAKAIAFYESCGFTFLDVGLEMNI